MFSHILIPTDGTELSRKAIEAGVAFARTMGARVTGFFAAPPATPLVYRDLVPVDYMTPEEHEDLIRRTAARYLGFVEKAATKAGVPCTSVTVTSDFPAEAILATARKRKCDLIFISSHGRKGIARAILGSQTQKVLAEAKIPVLVYR